MLMVNQHNLVLPERTLSAACAGADTLALPQSTAPVAGAREKGSGLGNSWGTDAQTVGGVAVTRRVR